VNILSGKRKPKLGLENHQGEGRRSRVFPWVEVDGPD
jgi:hypothetical protein